MGIGSYGVKYLPTIHAGHVDVGENECGMQVGQHPQGLATTHRNMRFDAV